MIINTINYIILYHIISYYIILIVTWIIIMQTSEINRNSSNTIRWEGFLLLKTYFSLQIIIPSSHLRIELQTSLTAPNFLTKLLLGFLGYLQYLQYSHIQRWFLFPSLPISCRWTNAMSYDSHSGRNLTISRRVKGRWSKPAAWCYTKKKHACNITWYILYPLVNLHR